jgi:hypothetical protein
MNEPTHPHFVLSDGQYCHVLEDRLVIGKRELPATMPAAKNKLDYVQLALIIGGLCLLSFFFVMTLITQYYVITFTLLMLITVLFFSLLRTASFTSTPIIMKDDIVGVDYHKRSFGYDFFIVRYSGEGGKLWKRRLVIYDSAESLAQALKVMHEAKLLPTADKA